MKKERHLQFINSIYIKPETYKDPDQLIIIFKDEDDNSRKKLMVIEEPPFSFYITKEGHEVSHPVSFIEKEKVQKIKCHYKDLMKTIADLLDEGNYYWECINSRQFNLLNKLHQEGNIFASDLNIEDYTKGIFLDKYKSINNKIDKGFFDIEVDTINYTGFPDEHLAPCPINAITYVDNKTETSYTFLLRNKKNPQIAKVEKNIKGLRKRANEMFDESFGKLKYKFEFFDSELDLIQAFYDCLNEIKPDFCGAWNMQFDKLTILNRIKNEYNVDPTEIICHDDFPKKICYYYEDRRNQTPEDNQDYFQASSYTIFLDMLNTFASLRKGLGKKESYSLNAVCQEELGDVKIEYSENSNIKTLPYDDYELFVLYNIKDVLLLKKLEAKNKDIDTLFQIAEMTRTRFNKAMKKTISLRNLANKFYFDQGYIMGNNLNTGYGSDDYLKSYGKLDKNKFKLHRIEIRECWY